MTSPKCQGEPTMLRKLAHTLLAFTLIACSTPPSAQTVEVTRIVQATTIVEVTRQVEVTRVVTTVPPTPTAPPTAVPATATGVANATEVTASGDQYSLACVPPVESGGIAIQVVRAVVAAKAAVGQDFSPMKSFDNVDVVGELVLRVTNT